jgi:hypothetical protein
MLSSESSASENSLLSTTPTTPFWQAGTWQDPLSATGQALGSSSQSLAFIDTSLADYQILEKGLQPGTVIYELNPQQNELAQITQVLAQYNNISSLSIFSHGNEGSLQLGNLNLNSSNLGSYASELHSWQQALAPGADLLFYGCNVADGEDGKAFVQQIHQFTGADVAASTDLTGDAAQGGNWTLEYQTGSIETQTILQPETEAAYDHVLQTFTVNSTADLSYLFPGLMTLRQAIILAQATPGDDEINFFLPSGSQINLQSQLQINDTSGKLNINGLSTPNLTISGNNQSRVFQIDRDSNVTLSGLAIANGKADTGGGIYNEGNLTLNNSSIQNNSARGSGGGIFNFGTLSLNNSQIANNSQISNNSLFGGGGICNFGSLTLNNSTISQNSATDYGGGIYTYWNSNLIVDNGSIIQGNTATYGGGIYNFAGTVKIDRGSAITGNQATDGAGIWNDSSLSLNHNSTISNNIAQKNGGGLYSGDGSRVTIQNSSVSGNRSVAGNGGGIFVVGNRYLSMVNSSLNGNQALVGGGMFISTYDRVTITSSTISSNVAANGGGGIANQGNLTLDRDTVKDNIANTFTGGGIWNNGGTLNTTNSTFSGNQAGFGGAIWNGNNVNNRNAIVNLTNSTLSGNNAALGGGVFNQLGTLNLKSDTISNNVGAGVVNNDRATVGNTIVAGNRNSSTNSISDVLGNFTSLGYNLIGSADANATGFVNAQNGDQVGTIANPINPKLGVLKINGSGTTATMALLPDSPAIDAGDPNMANNPTTDQRGVTRPQGARVDIGAFERILNAAPLALSDIVRVNPFSSVVIPVLSNDADPNGDPLTITNFTQPTSGILVKNPDSTFTYRSTIRFGVDSFTYTIQNSNGLTSTATVTIPVFGSNTNPGFLVGDLTSVPTSI